MVAVELDGNYIDAEPLKSRSAKDLTEAYKQFTPDGKPLESYAPTGMFSTTKHQRLFWKQFEKTVVESN